MESKIVRNRVGIVNNRRLITLWHFKA